MTLVTTRATLYPAMTMSRSVWFMVFARAKAVASGEMAASTTVAGSMERDLGKGNTLTRKATSTRGSGRMIRSMGKVR